MKNTPRTQSVSNKPKIDVNVPSGQYVDVNDLHLMLKLALGLHTVGDPRRRLTKATDGLARLTNADAWVMKTLTVKAGAVSVDPNAQLSGGTDAQAGLAAATRIDSECNRRETSVGKLLAARATPGRVLAVIDVQHAVHSVLREERSGRARLRITWISIHRDAGGPPFAERERRLLELFHSQSAWLLLQISE